MINKTNFKLIMVVAHSRNRAIGKDNKLLWHIPEDLKRFKKMTEGYPIIMGYNTFKSLKKPLKNRINIVITKQKLEASRFDDVLFVNSINEAIEGAKMLSNKVFIIGGESIYKQTINVVDKIEVTLIDENYEGDTFFPEIDEKIFTLTNVVKSKINRKVKFLSYKRNFKL